MHQEPPFYLPIPNLPGCQAQLTQVEFITEGSALNLPTSIRMYLEHGNVVFTLDAALHYDENALSELQIREFDAHPRGGDSHG